jgi:hypothetical protein
MKRFHHFTSKAPLSLLSSQSFAVLATAMLLLPFWPAPKIVYFTEPFLFVIYRKFGLSLSSNIKKDSFGFSRQQNWTTMSFHERLGAELINKCKAQKSTGYCCSSTQYNKNRNRESTDYGSVHVLRLTGEVKAWKISCRVSLQNLNSGGGGGWGLAYNFRLHVVVFPTLSLWILNPFLCLSEKKVLGCVVFCFVMNWLNTNLLFNDNPILH